jgi:hypothetical protein
MTCPRCGTMLTTAPHPAAECDAIYDEVYARARRRARGHDDPPRTLVSLGAGGWVQ